MQLFIAPTISGEAIVYECERSATASIIAIAFNAVSFVSPCEGIFPTKSDINSFLCAVVLTVLCTKPLMTCLKVTSSVAELPVAFWGAVLSSLISVT